MVEDIITNPLPCRYNLLSHKAKKQGAGNAGFRAQGVERELYHWDQEL